jgi:hypothetical protein
MSGSRLGGGGLAWVNTICNVDYGFAVTTYLHGMTPFPVPLRSGFNWDFWVVAHETGHSFGAFHTHEYCPPIDECGTPPWGPCQTRWHCQVGTIMSYCANCIPGVRMIKTVFHRRTAEDMRLGIQSSCAPSFPSAGVSLRNGSGVNPLGYTSSIAPEIGTTWYAQVDVTTTDSPFSVLAVGGGGPCSPTTAGPIGELLIDLSVPLRLLDLGAGQHWIPIPDDPSLLGQTVCTQAATFGVGRLQLQNALDLHLAY